MSIPLLIAASAFMAIATPVRAQTLEILEAGTYTVDKGNCVRDARGILLCDRLDLKLDHRTRDVPGALNIEFGVRYRITGIAVDRALPIRRVWRLPAPGFLPPGKPAIESLERLDRPRAEQIVHATYGFDDAWEVIPGEWVLEFWHGQDKLGEQRFQIVRPTS